MEDQEFNNLWCDVSYDYDDNINNKVTNRICNYTIKLKVTTKWVEEQENTWWELGSVQWMCEIMRCSELRLTISSGSRKNLVKT